MGKIAQYIESLTSDRGSLRLKHFGISSVENVDNKVIGIARTYEAAVDRAHERRKSGHLGDAGVREAISVAAKAAEAGLRAIEEQELTGSRKHADSIRSEIFKAPAVDEGLGLTTKADLRLALHQQFVQAAIFDQLRQLDPLQRELLARTETNPDVMRVLESELPIIRGEQRDATGRTVRMAHLEKMIPDDVRSEVQLKRARAAQPELASKIEELERLEGLMRGVVNGTREQIGLSVTALEPGSIARTGTQKMRQLAEPSQFQRPAGQEPVDASGITTT